MNTVNDAGPVGCGNPARSQTDLVLPLRHQKFSRGNVEGTSNYNLNVVKGECISGPCM